MMRLWITSVYIIAVCGLFSLDQPELAARVFSNIEKRSLHLWYHKEVWFSGTTLVDRRDLEPLLPLDESVLFWRMYPEQIVARLRAHPLVLNARVSACAEDDTQSTRGEQEYTAGWGCFSIHIDERHPKFVAMVGERGWVVGEDGGVLTPLPTEQSARITKSEEAHSFGGSYIPVVAGLLSQDESPDMVRARLAHAASAIKLISDRTGLSINRVTVERGLEMRVSFLEAPWTARFELQDREGGIERLEEQAERLQALRAHLKEQENQPQEIDLAFDTMAVARGVLSQAPSANLPSKKNR